MKTAIIVTQWLGTEDYINKSIKFYNYYLDPLVQQQMNYPDIWIVDNASPIEELLKIVKRFPDLMIQSYNKHYTRTAHLEYPYCWRAVYFARDLFQEHDYDKVIFLNNDSFIISQEMMYGIRNFKSGYYTPWCHKHNFKECEIQIITKDSEPYWTMTGTPYLSHNGEHMEDIIPSIPVYEWKGDRHSEYGIITQEKGWDFSTQVPLGMEIKYGF